MTQAEKDDLIARAVALLRSHSIWTTAEFARALGISSSTYFRCRPQILQAASAAGVPTGTLGPAPPIPRQLALRPQPLPPPPPPPPPTPEPTIIEPSHDFDSSELTLQEMGTRIAAGAATAVDLMAAAMKSPRLDPKVRLKAAQVALENYTRLTSNLLQLQKLASQERGDEPVEVIGAEESPSDFLRRAK